MRIRYSPKFARQYKKLPQEIKEQAEKKETIFRKNPFDQRLRTHKLHGSQADFYSFSVTYSYRVMFSFEKGEEVVFYEIGDHDIYD